PPRDPEPERSPTDGPRVRPVSAEVPTADLEPSTGSYAVLVATLSDPGLAEHLRSRIAIKFADARVDRLDVGVARCYRGRIGPYPNRGVALARAALVNRYGYPAVITDESQP